MATSQQLTTRRQLHLISPTAIDQVSGSKEHHRITRALSLGSFTRPRTAGRETINMDVPLAFSSKELIWQVTLRFISKERYAHLTNLAT